MLSADQRSISRRSIRDEFDLTWAEIVGVLEVIKSNLMAEAREIAGDQEDEGEEADA
ncbi:MAG: hypothetical protein KGL35_23005 [Bradyrhizobium sp.]|nr:hypothetical protein [Bradyrhizobium sp.]